MSKRTKIITTLGPSTTDPKTLTELISAGTDVFRLNLSHAKIEEAKADGNDEETISPEMVPLWKNMLFLVLGCFGLCFGVLVGFRCQNRILHTFFLRNAMVRTDFH